MEMTMTMTMLMLAAGQLEASGAHDFISLRSKALNLPNKTNITNGANLYETNKANQLPTA